MCFISRNKCCRESFRICYPCDTVVGEAHPPVSLGYGAEKERAQNEERMNTEFDSTLKMKYTIMNSDFLW